MNNELRFAATITAGLFARPWSCPSAMSWQAGALTGGVSTMAHVNDGFATKRITAGVLGGLT